MKTWTLTTDWLSIETLRAVVEQKVEITLGEGCRNAVEKCRRYLDEKITNSEVQLYGINTGFGSLCNTSIDTEQLEQLQVNLVRSHACGMGEEVHPEIVRLMLLLKAIGLSKGYFFPNEPNWTPKQLMCY